MGVEWSIGCIKCKKQIWLGSQKPFSWKGFQIGDKNVKRFLSLHSNCSSQLNGNLLLINDGTNEIPWENNKEIQEWREDILSRTFCFDSLKIDYLKNTRNIICAHCGCELESNVEQAKQKGNIKKNEFLWFCNDSCFDNYINYNERDREILMYDSTKDNLPLTTDIFEIGCLKCMYYVIIDYNKNSLEQTRDFEFLALFLCDHVGHDHILKVNIDNVNIPWKEMENSTGWKEYEY